MTAINFLWDYRIIHCGWWSIPMSTEHPCTWPTKSEVKRWLKNKAVIINGKRPKSNDEIKFPITELVYFSNSKRRTTIR